jgi:hypothetical protein
MKIFSPGKLWQKKQKRKRNFLLEFKEKFGRDER